MVMWGLVIQCDFHVAIDDTAATTCWHVLGTPLLKRRVDKNIIIKLVSLWLIIIIVLKRTVDKNIIIALIKLVSLGIIVVKKTVDKNTLQ